MKAEIPDDPAAGGRIVAAIAEAATGDVPHAEADAILADWLARTSGPASPCRSS